MLRAGQSSAGTRAMSFSGASGRIQELQGAVPAPFDCCLTLRGIRMLPLRMAAHSEKAGRVAEYLRGHPRLAAVHYPGLPEHPGHQTAARQMTGFGGMLSVQVAGGRAAARVQVFVQATIRGGNAESD